MIVGRTALVVALAASVVGLTGQLGVAFQWADSINYLTPVWLATGVLAASIAVLTRRGCGLAAAMATLIVLLLTGGVNLLKGAGAASTEGPATLTIVQFNVSKANRRPAASAAWILAQQPDVVVLEEAALRGAQIRALLQATYPYATDCLGNAGRCSTVVLSRQRQSAAEGLAHGDPENRRTLSAVMTRIFDDDGPFTVVGVHLRRPWPFDDQTSDINLLSRLLQSEDQSRLIIVGDLNQPPWTFAMRRQDKALRIPRLTGNLATWPVGRFDIASLSLPFPTILPIDHLYAGKGWRLVSSRRGPDLGSDHRPLVVKLARIS